MKAPSKRTLQYISLYSDDAARVGYSHIKARKAKKDRDSKKKQHTKGKTMLTKSAEGPASPGQAIYDLLRVYRKGARYGVMLSPVANKGKMDEAINQVSTLKNKLDSTNLVQPEVKDKDKAPLA